MTKQLVIACVVLVGVLVALIVIRQQSTPDAGPIACTMDAKMCPDGSAVGRVGPSCDFAPCPELPEATGDPMINITTPTPDEVVTSLIEITGKARGSWFSEGVFMAYLVDPNEYIINEVQVAAQNNWMTDAFVPFTASLSFSLPPDATYDHGSLILMRDTPSGLPENDDMRKIPIRFDTKTQPTP